MKTLTQISAAACTARTVGLTPISAGIAKLTMIDAVAIHLTLRRIAPLRRQSAMGGPNLGCSISQRCTFSDDLAKQKAASSRKGTVGNKGRNAPMAPRPTHSHPKPSQKILISNR